MRREGVDGARLDAIAAVAAVRLPRAPLHHLIAAGVMSGAAVNLALPRRPRRGRVGDEANGRGRGDGVRQREVFKLLAAGPLSGGSAGPKRGVLNTEAAGRLLALGLAVLYREAPIFVESALATGRHASAGRREPARRRRGLRLERRGQEGEQEKWRCLARSHPRLCSRSERARITRPPGAVVSAV